MDDLNKRDSYLEMIRGCCSGAVICRVVANGSMWEQDRVFYKQLEAEHPNVGIGVARDPAREYYDLCREVWGCICRYLG